MRANGDRSDRFIDGRYVIDAVLGRGGMGVVYAGRHLATGRDVAVKILREELRMQSDFVQRFRQEAQLAVRAAHPNVVQVLDSGVDERTVPYIVLERLYGATLEAKLAAALDPFTTAWLLTPIAGALAALHRSHVVHRDIKPSNLFLSVGHGPSIMPKVVDFGVAKALEGSAATRTGWAVGTPAYMAPEQVLGGRTVGPAADIWSLAVVWIRCLTGQVPQELGGGPLAMAAQPARVAGSSAIPPPVAEVLARALAFDPRQRLGSMGAFQRQLLDALERLAPSRQWPPLEATEVDCRHLPPWGDLVRPAGGETPQPLPHPEIRVTKSLVASGPSRLESSRRSAVLMSAVLSAAGAAAGVSWAAWGHSGDAMHAPPDSGSSARGEEGPKPVIARVRPLAAPASAAQLSTLEVPTTAVSRAPTARVAGNAGSPPARSRRESSSRAVEREGATPTRAAREVGVRRRAQSEARLEPSETSSTERAQRFADAARGRGQPGPQPVPGGGFGEVTAPRSAAPPSVDARPRFGANRAPILR